MKKVMQVSLLIIITIVFSACTKVSGPKLAANYFYKGNYIDIHAPNSEGWSLLEKSNSEIRFGKQGKNSTNTYVARVIFFPLPLTETKEEFYNLIKILASKSSNKRRFITIESGVTPSTERNYPCVLVKQLFKDKKAKTSYFSTQELFMQVKSLYCKDPKREQVGFMIGYSFRGESVNEIFDTEADSFIKNVTLSK